MVAYASPLKLFEYMAAGKAIVAPDQPNIREVLSDGETALLFDPAEPDAMWRAISRLAADATLRGTLGGRRARGNRPAGLYVAGECREDHSLGSSSLSSPNQGS